mmetsp:Transcript_6212/g.21187  ORF Transcript_6212/g.21187 Transcript_6212/m.21187 type:complete len:288 (+) Transcript_6212:708-1571(+)
MAPEVMEQVEGYDYKADIWSFGITALELAKGFAPYAFHPPMKVLLLTIQEEPPSLRSYATEKSCTGESFSRSFKEMVRMCLQKEARKRPTVHTLLNSKFFKIERSVTPLVNELLCHVRNISVEDGPIHDYEDCATPHDALLDHDNAEPSLRDGTEPAKLSSTRRTAEDLKKNADDAHSDGRCLASVHACIAKTGESGEFVRGTTWTFEDGQEVVLKSESFIRREIDAKCAQDDQECAAIFDDLEDLMNQRGGEWDFKKNQDVYARDEHSQINKGEGRTADGNELPEN